MLTQEADPPQALIRCYSQSSPASGTVFFDLHDEERIDQVLTVGHHGISHGVKLGMLLSSKCSVAVVSIKHIREWVA